MAKEYVGGNPNRAPFYARRRDAATGLYANTASESYVELTSAAIGQFSFAAAQEGSFELYSVERPAWDSADRDVVVELIRGEIASEAASDPKHAERLQTKGVSQVRVDVAAVAANVTSIKATVETDIITAKSGFRKDADEDKYSLAFLRNDDPLTSGITGTPTLTVVNAAGTTIFTTNLTTVTTGKYRHTESGNRVPAGEEYRAIYAATIDDVAKTWEEYVGRDEASS
jgi:hypothetical protein